MKSSPLAQAIAVGSSAQKCQVQVAGYSSSWKLGVLGQGPSDPSVGSQTMSCSQQAVSHVSKAQSKERRACLCQEESLL